ncbi:MAG: flippase-like domain-containing protein [Promethearchaeota archaeon]|nr:MAG: flippase-like domain-containing protein [Candidatus Lokiarchaeota archaeon]
MKEITKRILIGISTIMLIIVMILYVDIKEILNNLNKISVLGIFLFILIYTTTFILRSFKLKQVFHGLNLKSSLLILYCSYGVGFAINELTPGKFGDLARIEFIQQKEKNISLSKSLCGVSIERFIDLLVLFSFISLVTIYLYLNNFKGTSNLNLHIYLGIGALLLCGAIVVLILLFFTSNWILNIIGKISSKFKHRLELFLENFLNGVNEFRKNKKSLIKVIILSFPTWFLDTLTLVLLFYLLGYEIHIFIIIMAQIIVFFTKAFPITPGGWVISENVGSLLIFLFYPSIPYNIILSIFILDHLIRSAYIFVYGVFSSVGFNFKFEKMIKQI